MTDYVIKLSYNDGTEAVIVNDAQKVITEMYYKLAKIENLTDEIKNYLSSNTDLIPLYDVFSKNLYIINSENVYNRVTNYHYRLPDKKIVSSIEKSLININPDDPLTSAFHDKLLKNLNFIKNFDLDILEKTYYKLFYLSQPETFDLTSCIKPSFVPFLTNKPYYTKSELVNLGLNMGLTLSDDLSKVCKLVSDSDITSDTILNHQQYIKKCHKSYIQLYTLLGSYYWNQYLRLNNLFRDLFLEEQIKTLYNIVKDSPPLDKDYWVYRFIENDDYLSSVKIGSYFLEESFISATRNPFYDVKNNVFGFILIKIKLPKNIKGVGLCIETYSLFPHEEEILLNPSKLKLLSIDTNYKYYHPDTRASKKIQKMYTFEYIEMLPLKNTEEYSDDEKVIPNIDFLHSENKGDDFPSKLYYFFNNMILTRNNKKYFKTEIGNKEYLFQAFYLNHNLIYEKYFFLLKQDDKHREVMYLILQDEKSGEIYLLIELRDTISVNYIHRFIGTPDVCPFLDEDLILFLSKLSHFFGINEVIIHDRYKSYDKISNDIIKKYNSENNNILSVNDNHIISLFSGDFKYYNVNLILSIEQKGLIFNNIPGLSFNLKQHHFQRFSKINALDIFSDIEKSPLYNILIKQNKFSNHELNILEFYIFIHYNYFYFIKELNKLIIDYDTIIYKNQLINPWINSYSILNSEEYLFDKGIIKSVKLFKTNLFQDYLMKLNEEQKRMTNNNYRLGLVKLK